MSYPQLCFAWVLAQEPVAGLVKTMKTVGEVYEYVGASGAKLAAVEMYRTESDADRFPSGSASLVERQRSD